MSKAGCNGESALLHLRGRLFATPFHYSHLDLQIVPPSNLNVRDVLPNLADFPQVVYSFHELFLSLLPDLLERQRRLGILGVPDDRQNHAPVLVLEEGGGDAGKEGEEVSASHGRRGQVEEDAEEELLERVGRVGHDVVELGGEAVGEVGRGERLPGGRGGQEAQDCQGLSCRVYRLEVRGNVKEGFDRRRI